VTRFDEKAPLLVMGRIEAELRAWRPSHAATHELSDVAYALYYGAWRLWLDPIDIASEAIEAAHELEL
jgi:hypothetical protein